MENPVALHGRRRLVQQECIDTVLGRDYRAAPYSGHQVDIKVKDGVTFIFGSESNHVYIEAFREHDGVCLFRFITDYCEATSDRLLLNQ